MRKLLLDGMRPAVFGLVVGLAASLAAGRLMRDLLYEIKPLDPVVLAAVAATLIAVAAFANERRLGDNGQAKRLELPDRAFRNDAPVLDAVATASD